MSLQLLRQQRRWAYLAALLSPLAGSLLLLPLRPLLSPTDIAMLMLLWVSLLALEFGAAPALLSTVISVLLLNWYYVPPYYTLDVHDSGNIVSFVVMSVFGLLISYLANRLKMQMSKRRALMSQLRLLYRLTSGLNRQSSWQAQCHYVARVLSRRLRAQVYCQPFDNKVAPEMPANLHWMAVGEPTVAKIATAAATARQHSALFKAVADLLWQHWQFQQLQLQNTTQQVQMEREQHRAALLRSLSHDLRTPLATIVGASSMLADPQWPLTDSQRQAQAANIYRQSLLLNNHFEKVLELSKAQLSADALRLSQFSADDLIAGALARRPDLSAAQNPLLADLLAKTLASRQAAIELAGDLDLLEIALANLLENAVRYGASPASLSFHSELLPNGQRQFELRLTNQVRQQMTAQTDAGHGLGLQICRSIAALHQGSCSFMQQDRVNVEGEYKGEACSILRWQTKAAETVTQMMIIAGQAGD